jgi:hypothetical protein
MESVATSLEVAIDCRDASGATKSTALGAARLRAVHQVLHAATV